MLNLHEVHTHPCPHTQYKEQLELGVNLLLWVMVLGSWVGAHLQRGKRNQTGQGGEKGGGRGEHNRNHNSKGHDKRTTGQTTPQNTKQASPQWESLQPSKEPATGV